MSAKALAAFAGSHAVRCRTLSAALHAAQVFDGHGGATAAVYAREHLLAAVVRHPGFPADVPAALVRAADAPARAAAATCKPRAPRPRRCARKCGRAAPRRAHRGRVTHWALPRLSRRRRRTPSLALQLTATDAPRLLRRLSPARGAGIGGRGAARRRRRFHVRHNSAGGAAARPPPLHRQRGRLPRGALPPRAAHRAQHRPQADNLLGARSDRGASLLCAFRV
jgi:hypothetical protein